jgi:hypothetical protein
VLTPIDKQQLDQRLLADPDTQEAAANANIRIFGSPRDLNLKWRYEDEVVATLDGAEYVLQGERLVFRHYAAPADEEQCDRILKVFEANATVSNSYEGDRVLAPFERYQKHRDTIRTTLLKELVSKVGYEKHHIVRELLQNAESAYASKRERIADSSFEFAVIPAGATGWRRIVARHSGRAFNEPDNLGNPRHDVERIWRLAAESERTPDEVGRFNRGFKTLFTVARDGVVRIQSGHYDFEVIDLLLLRPAQPKPNPQARIRDTEFSFEVSFSDALEMLKLARSPQANDPFPVINASTLVFLRHMRRVLVRFHEHNWQWVIDLATDDGGWSRVSVTEAARSREDFLVFSGQEIVSPSNGQPRKFGVAVRLGRNGLPQLLEKTWKTFRLTFETEHAFPLDFIINGDFDADQGRIGLRNITRSGLVELAYEAVLARAERELRAKPDKDVWLAWARVLHLKDAPTELQASFRDDAQRLKSLTDRTKELFVGNIPHGGALTPAGQLQFPSQLFRRLAPLFGQTWGLSTERWIDLEIDLAMPEITVSRLTLHGWLNQFLPQAPLLRTIDRDLKSPQFTRLRLSGVEQNELNEARQVLQEKLRPVLPPTPPEVKLPQLDPWTVENLWFWWLREGKPASIYTLEGDGNWELLYPKSPVAPGQRAETLTKDLLAAESARGQETWYRLLSLACLMAAGRRMSEVQDFWNKELDRRGFWDATCSKAFGKGTDALFDDLISRRFSDVKACGEDAHFWRRVFYDIRKIHKLVWESNFPSTILQLIETGRAAQLPNFLRSGLLSGQQAWVGVFGQSAGAPLFFLIRELCRLEIIKSPEVKPLALFVATPVRRAAERIGWIPSEMAARVDFQSLAETSEFLFMKISSDAKYGPQLLDFYDIPLLHLGLNW